MKVGILTFHFGRNYGALLQAYGLCKAIASIGHKSCVVHYLPQHASGYMTAGENAWLRLGWRTAGPRMAIERRLRTYRFNRFKEKKLHLTRLCHTKDELVQLLSTFDAVAVGSDQVWNLNFVQSDDLCYFLDFPVPDTLRCLSYAACCGRKDQPAAHLHKVAPLLGKFHSIGVRNPVTAEFVKHLCGRDSTIVADPTLLVGYDEVEEICNYSEKYIFVYVLERNSVSDYAKVIGTLRQRLNLPVWAVSDGNRIWQDEPFPGADRNWFGVSPSRFLSLLKQAQCVVTDSFHGTIFSVKYQKPFVTLDDGSWRNMRMEDLAQRYGVGHRIQNVHAPVDPSLLSRTDDLSAILQRFNAHRDLSFGFLKKSLESGGSV